MELLFAMFLMLMLFVGALFTAAYLTAKRTVRGTKKIASVTLNFVRR